MSRVIKACQVDIEVYPEPPEHSSLPANGRAAADARVAAELLREAKREAHRLLLRSQEIAARRLAQAAAKESAVEQALHEARETGRREGYEKGYEEGYRAGFAQGREEALQEYRQLVEAARAILEEARQAQWRLERQAEEDIVKLAVAMAEKMTRQALAQDGTAHAILRDMLARVEGSPTARVRLPKATFERLQVEAELPAATPGGCVLEFLPDEALRQGDVVIETDWGLIDGRVQSRWRRIIQGLDLVELNADDGR